MAVHKSFQFFKIQRQNIDKGLFVFTPLSFIERLFIFIPEMGKNNKQYKKYY